MEGLALYECGRRVGQCLKKHANLGGRRAQLDHVNKCESQLCKLLSSLILENARRARDRKTEGVKYVEETGIVGAGVEQKEMLHQLQGRFTNQVIRKVTELHTQLGHPDRLAAELLDLNMTPEHVACARVFLWPSHFATTTAFQSHHRDILLSRSLEVGRSKNHDLGGRVFKV